MNAIPKIHADEAEISLPHVRAMLAEQFPAWAALPIELVTTGGTDNVMLRLGDELLIRLPRTASAAEALARENRYPALLAPHLPVTISAPLAQGKPNVHYPFAWSIGRWITGRTPTCGECSPLLATQLGEFVRALHAIPTAGYAISAYRGGPVSARDALTRESIAQCAPHLDAAALLQAWDNVSQVSENTSGACWLHTDIQPGNVLIDNGELAAVIDWGGIAIGDPAVDMIVAWNLMGAEAREHFRQAVKVDDETWRRGRAWALSIGVIAYIYYVDKEPSLTRTSRYQLEQVAAEMGLTL
ncbi:aminoglycoside phosphotransferase family protein [Serratia sp. SRS-8-S-2018]|uniref:aminoglycoside phosphotransferase family protein n=2 Tax=Serratia TaxID=613 RepID=UPI0009B58AE0|nr:phosphotransferase [Serratia marcescens]MCI2403203.1 aminoglycoside phosphotransferase family protein [Serratia sp. PGPR-27]TPW54887.1 aminoglycoside phosphotransferase family protein [Serratia sp. SRS-8-S-2018]EIT7184209.1 aminoglycoside phosphotransferase family protein [Serratia marcescens]EJC6393037.1 aminoglycoside phosphotransferase family protein [Serratia marcescens]